MLLTCLNVIIPSAHCLIAYSMYMNAYTHSLLPCLTMMNHKPRKSEQEYAARTALTDYLQSIRDVLVAENTRHHDCIRARKRHLRVVIEVFIKCDMV